MLERLYCPDFSAIFGSPYRNPFDLPMIDGLVWPTFTDLEHPDKLKRLLALTKDGQHPLFYRRKITLNHLITECKVSGIKGVCLQAMELGPERDYGIPSEVVINASEMHPNWIFPIVSPEISEKGVKKLKSFLDKAVAVVIYPSYQKIDLSNPPKELYDILNLCSEKQIPVKIDLGYMYLPDNDQTLCTPEKVRALVSKRGQNLFIISGIDLLGTGKQILNLLRYERNLVVELDPRTFGGMTPELFFDQIFAIPGLIQNAWSRIILGSSTPMLESSQITRGWWKATEKLPFAQKHLLRTWAYRNIVRLYSFNKTNEEDSNTSKLTNETLMKNSFSQQYPLIFNSNYDLPEAIPGELQKPKVIKKENGDLFIQQDLVLNSFSITQLIYITPYILKAAESCLANHSDYRFGEFTLKSYHTTTSIVVNEHEFGNYLQLHYFMVEQTMAEAKDKLHTVAALENRADFNFPDHILASSVGDKDFTVPILDGKIQLGGRENLYILVTFGPRSLKLSLTFKLFKGQQIE